MEKTLIDVENNFNDFLAIAHNVLKNKSLDELKVLLEQYKIQSSIFALTMSVVLENHIYMQDLFKK